MAERTVAVKLSANTTQYIAAMKQAQSATTDLSITSQKDFQALGSKMQSVGSTMTKGVTLPLAGVGVAAVKMSGDFDTAFSQMIGLAGVGAEEIDGLKESVLDLAGKTARSPQELADALYFLRSSGLGAEEAMSALEVSAKASAAGLGNTATIADAVSSAMNAYAKSGLTAAEATDVLVGTARAGKAEPEQLAASLGRVLPIASELGVTFKDVGGAIASLSLTGNDAAQSSTLLTNVLSKLLKPSQQGAEALADVGLSTDSIRASIADDGLLPTLDMLRGKLGDSGFVKVFEDAQAVQGVLALTGQNADGVRVAFEGVANSAGSTEEAFAAVDKNAMALKQSWVDIQIALIKVGSILGPIVADLAGRVSDLAGWFSDLDPTIQKIVIAVAALAAAAGPVLIVAGSMIRNFTTLKTSMTNLSTASPRMAAALGIAAGVMAVMAVNAKRSADEQRELAEIMGEVGRAAGTEQLGRLHQALVVGSANGKDYAATIAELVKGNEGLATQLIENIETSDSESAAWLRSKGTLELLTASRNDEIIATAQQADAQDRATDSTEAATAAYEDWSDWAGRAGVEVRELTAAEKEAAEQQDAMAATAEEVARQVDEMRSAGVNAEAAFDGLTDILEEQEKAQRAAAEAAKEHAERIDDLFEANLRLIGGDIAVRESQRQAAAAIAELNELSKEGKRDTDEYAAAQDDAASAILGAAQAAAQLEIDQLRAAGATITAGEETRIQRDHLNALAQLLEPNSPLRQQIEGYVADLAAIPGEIETIITARTDQAALAQVASDLDQLTRWRNATIGVSMPGVKTGGFHDSGGYANPGDWVAERRPEFVNGHLVMSPMRLASPAYVTSGSDTARILAASSSVTSASMGGGSASGGVLVDADVRVFVGDREITDIARTEVRSAQRDLAGAITAGRRP